MRAIVVVVEFGIASFWLMAVAGVAGFTFPGGEEPIRTGWAVAFAVFFTAVVLPFVEWVRREYDP
jgi:hypothetical protein